MTRIQPKHYDKIKKSMPLPCVDLLVTQKGNQKPLEVQQHSIQKIYLIIAASVMVLLIVGILLRRK